MNKWLQTFAYHEDLGIDVFVLSALLVTVFALGTVAYQSVKAAVTNPVDTLRYE
jgi:putative ABC transport system permease protein